MFEVSKMVNRINGSERSQMRITIPEGAIRLDLGEPDLPTPVHIQEAATQAMKDNFTHYGSSYGDEELRQAVCLSLKRDYGVERNPGDVLITPGGIEAINAIAATFLNPGDEVLIMDPGYSAYTESVRLFAGKPVPVSLRDDFHLDIKGVEGRISRRTKMIFLANPSNPTGVVHTKEEISALGKIAVEHNLILVVDEVYNKLVYEGGAHFSICQLNEVRDRAILINSFSKTYAMTGWRVGYIVADAKIVNSLELFNKTMLLCVNTVAQKACVAALTGPQDCVNSMLAEYDKRRRLVDETLKGIDGISYNPCEAAFYFFPHFRFNLTSREMTSYLAERKVLVRSGTEFGERGQKHIRLSFTTSIELIEEGLERLKQAFNELRQNGKEGAE